jgi:hypothetical protein
VPQLEAVLDPELRRLGTGPGIGGADAQNAEGKGLASRIAAEKSVPEALATAIGLTSISPM